MFIKTFLNINSTIAIGIPPGFHDYLKIQTPGLRNKNHKPDTKGIDKTWLITDILICSL